MACTLKAVVKTGTIANALAKTRHALPPSSSKSGSRLEPLMRPSTAAATSSNALDAAQIASETMPRAEANPEPCTVLHRADVFRLHTGCTQAASDSLVAPERYQRQQHCHSDQARHSPSAAGPAAEARIAQSLAQQAWKAWLAGQHVRCDHLIHEQQPACSKRGQELP